jgi:menaquinone-dependent protoporphyrinogen oxidase
MSRNVLVAYATKMGATAGIAEAVGAELERDGHQVDVREVGKVGSIEQYDVVVLGSALYMRRWRPEAVRFLRKHSDELRERQVWLFHSGPVGADHEQPQKMPANVERLAHRIGATAAMTFGGRLEPATAKGFLAQRMARSDLAGDSRDWETIRAWAADINAAIHATEAAPWNRHLA